MAELPQLPALGPEADHNSVKTRESVSQQLDAQLLVSGTPGIVCYTTLGPATTVTPAHLHLAAVQS